MSVEKLKSLKDISLQISEEEYRNDGCLHYSTLATYERGGFNSLKNIFEKKKSPSLLFGSCVDCLLTDGEDAFNENYAVMDINITDDGQKVVKELASIYKDTFKEFKEIPVPNVSSIAKDLEFWPANKWSDNARYNGLLKTGDVHNYYKALITGNRTIITTELYSQVLAAVDALKTSEATKWYFAENNPFDDIERLYQLKFRSTFNGIDYSCMADEIIVDYDNKTIQMIDLKTSSHHEWEFHKSFKDWSYFIQAKLYAKILKDNILKDEFFSDFTILPYIFIVVNKETLTPLVWIYEDTFAEGTQYYGKDKQIIVRDPTEIGAELNEYLTNEHKVPIGIEINKPNSIINYLDTL